MTSHSRPGETVVGAPAASFAVETYLLRAETIKQTFRIKVQRPCLVPGQRGPFPVVYVTDANFFLFDTIRGLALALHATREAPPFILVGIEYPSDSPFAGATLRARDLTFPPFPELDPKAVPPMDEGQLLPEEGAKDFNGGEDFLQFIKEQLIPFIDEKYDTARDERTYFGHSGGGFFGLFVLFTDPALFSSYICSSPALLIDGPAPGGTRYDNYHCGIPLIEKFIASGQSLHGTKLYLSVGEDEDIDGRMGSWRMVAGVTDLLKTLDKAQIAGLEIMSETFAAESHVTVMPSAFIHGVQAVFGTRHIVTRTKPKGP